MAFDVLINEILDNTTGADINVTYNIQPEINGCNGTPFVLTVTVEPTPVATIANTTATVCTARSWEATQEDRKPRRSSM